MKIQIFQKTKNFPESISQLHSQNSIIIEHVQTVENIDKDKQENCREKSQRKIANVRRCMERERRESGRDSVSHTLFNINFLNKN